MAALASCQAQRVLMAALVVVCVSSDAFLAQQYYLTDAKLLRHLVDSSAHGAVAFCCWGVFLCQTEHEQLFSTGRRSSSSSPSLDNLEAHANDDDVNDERGDPSIDMRPWLVFLQRCVLAGVAAALLDVDHFIAAGSFSISGATHLKHRPFGHAVTFVAALALLVYKCSSSSLPLATRTRRACFVVVTLLSHQLRDGMRLGLWFWPLGSTPPIQYLLYLALEEALPFAMGYWQNRVAAKASQLKHGGAFLAVALDEDDGDRDDREGKVGLRVITARDGTDDDK